MIEVPDSELTVKRLSVGISTVLHNLYSGFKNLGLSMIKLKPSGVAEVSYHVPAVAEKKMNIPNRTSITDPIQVVLECINHEIIDSAIYEGNLKVSTSHDRNIRKADISRQGSMALALRMLRSHFVSLSQLCDDHLKKADSDQPHFFNSVLVYALFASCNSDRLHRDLTDRLRFLGQTMYPDKIRMTLVYSQTFLFGQE